MSLADLYPALSKAAIAWVLTLSGATPRITTIDAARPFITGRAPLRVGVVQHALRVRLTCPVGARVSISDGEGAAFAVSPGGSVAIGFASAGLMMVQVDTARMQTQSAVSVSSNDPHRSITVTSENGSLARGIFSGNFQVALGNDDRVNVINLVPLEDYVAGVLQGEMPESFPLAALQAQAVAARSYALGSLGEHGDDGFDLCAEVDCQVYRGRDAAGPRQREAARTTAGQVLTYRGTIVRAFFGSDCGGATDDVANVWWNCLLPYVRAARDAPRAKLTFNSDAATRAQLADGAGDFCRDGPRHRWEVKLSRAQVQTALDRNLAKMIGQPDLQVGILIDLAVKGRSRAGRAQTLVITITTGEYTIHRNSMRWLFGNGEPSPGSLPSTLFVIDRVTNADGGIASFTFRGAGHGHGLGLCQWGAKGRALAGQSARDILKAYYPGVTLSRLGK